MQIALPSVLDCLMLLLHIPSQQRAFNVTVEWQLKALEILTYSLFMIISRKL